jgi:hypothetical protein
MSTNCTAITLKNRQCSRPGNVWENSEQVYCYQHYKINVLNKSIPNREIAETQKDDCCICLEPNIDEFELPCKHSVHKSCLQKHFKPECPVCRRLVRISVNGTRPGLNTEPTQAVLEVEQLIDSMNTRRAVIESMRQFRIDSQNRELARQQDIQAANDERRRKFFAPIKSIKKFFAGMFKIN